jgi:flagellar M-ring protein FliF
MAVSMDGFLKQFRSFWEGLSTSRRLALIGVSAAVLGAFALIVMWGGRPAYRPLFASLNQEDAAAIVERLKERKAPYRLAGGGGTIEVPEESLYELRLALATEGLPQGGGVGFEVFDRSAFGATEFVQRVNLQRALQGELSRTIRQFPQVAHARVHLTIPERSLFVREAQRPQATVVLQLHPGTSLQPSQLQGIVHLVASAVQSMQAQDVHVVDTTGRVLYSPRDGQEGEGASGRILERQVDMERRLEAKIQGILEPVLGSNRVVARVHVDLDPRRVEQTEEQYDPDRSAVRSEQRSSERSVGAGPSAGGVPGVLSNLPDAKAPGATGNSSSTFQRENETVNYEVNRLTRRTVATGGEVRRLTVAVLVDGVKKAVAGSDGKETWSVVARSPEETKQYEEIVKQAVGFNAQRGDELQVASVPFERMDEAREAPSGIVDLAERWSTSPLVRHGVILLLSLLFLLLVVRPLVRGVLSVLEAPEPSSNLPRTVRELEGGHSGTALPKPSATQHAIPSVVPAPALPVEVMQMAEMDPQRFAAALKAWMRHGE